MRLLAKGMDVEMVLTTAATILSVGTMLLSPIPTARSEPPLGIPGVQVLTDIDQSHDAYYPTISDDGRVIAFVSYRKGTWDVYVYDRKTRQLFRPGPLAGSEDPIGAALSGDGQFIIAAHWNTIGARTSGLSLYDRTRAKLVPLPGLSIRGNAREPAISGNGRFITFVDETKRGAMRRYEARLYDRWRQTMEPLPLLQHQFADVSEPTVDNRGRYVAFAAGAGLPPQPPHSRLFLYDRQDDRLIDLPGLDALTCSLSGHLTGDGQFLVFMDMGARPCGARMPSYIQLYDVSRKVEVVLPKIRGWPAISPNGRFIVFVREDGVFVYDRQG